MTNQSVSDIPRGKNAHYKVPGCFLCFFCCCCLKWILVLLDLLPPSVPKGKVDPLSQKPLKLPHVDFFFSFPGLLDLTLCVHIAKYERN